MRVFVAAALLATSLPPVLTASPAIADTPATTALSVESSDLGTLLDNPAAKAVLVKHVPALVGNDQIAMARSMTLKQLQSYAGDMLTDEKLALIQADLDRIAKH
jgi:para-nitrobenzyl esterase